MKRDAKRQCSACGAVDRRFAERDDVVADGTIVFCEQCNFAWEAAGPKMREAILRLVRQRDDG